jgi:hypothetical protein
MKELGKDDFESAIDLLGEEWLQRNHEKYYKNETKSKKFAFNSESAPPAVIQYHGSKVDLQEEDENPLNYQGFRNDTLEFLMLGRVWDKVSECDVIHPAGESLPDLSPKELYQGELRTSERYFDKRFELEVAATYIELGHKPAFIAESKTESKSPDLELTDFKERIQIECKRCTSKSVDEEKRDNKINILFQNLHNLLPSGSFIALFDLSRVPTRSEVENIGSMVSEIPRLDQYEEIAYGLPYGKVHIIKNESSFLQPIYGLEGIEIMMEAYESIVRPVLKKKLDIDEDAEDLGNWAFLTETKTNAVAAQHREPVWVGLKTGFDESDLIKRFRNQFSGISDKFDAGPSILHIDYPDLREGDSVQDFELRKNAGGRLKQRPKLSAAVVSGKIHRPVFSDDIIRRNRIIIPNYDPDYPLPSSFGPDEGDFTDLISSDQLRRDMDVEAVKNEKAGKEAIGRDEGTILFRFKPRESKSTDQEKHIIKQESLDGNTRIELNVTPEENLILRRLDTESGYWCCSVDISDIPEFDPLSVDHIGLEEVSALGRCATTRSRQ